MTKLYFIVLLSIIVFGAYFYGFNIADAKCRIQNLQESENVQDFFIQTKKDIHEKVYKTGVRDIRRILCDKYTIQDQSDL